MTRRVFTKKLSKTDVGTRLAIPIKLLAHFPAAFQTGNNSVELQIADEYGNAWNMRCKIRKCGHKKPVMSAGWRPFVRYINLQVNDKITFCVVQGDDAGRATYKIKVQKAFKLFGTIMGYCTPAINV